MKRLPLEERLRKFLLEDFEMLVAYLATDADEDGNFDPETAHLIDNLHQVICWLRGGPRPDADIRRFLEEKLESVDADSQYDEITLEHDAVVAAIEALR
jgi:hypothetical protein